MNGTILGLIFIAAGIAVWILEDWLFELSLRAYENKYENKDEDI